MANFVQPFQPGPVIPASVTLAPAFSSAPPVPEHTPVTFWPDIAPGPVLNKHHPVVSVDTSTVTSLPNPSPSRIPDFLAKATEYQKQKAIQEIKQLNYDIDEIDKEIEILDSHIDEIEKIRKRVRQWLRRPFPFTYWKPKPEDNSILERKIDEGFAEMQRRILSELLSLVEERKKGHKRIKDIRRNLELTAGVVLTDDEVSFISFLSLAPAPEVVIGDSDSDEWEDIDDDDQEERDADTAEAVFAHYLQKRGDPSAAESAAAPARAPQALFQAPANLHPYGRYPVPKEISFDDMILGIHDPYAERKPELEGSHNRYSNPSEKHIKQAEKAQKKAEREEQKRLKKEEKARKKAEKKRLEKEAKEKEEEGEETKLLRRDQAAFGIGPNVATAGERPIWPFATGGDDEENNYRRPKKIGFFKKLIDTIPFIGW